MTKTTSPAGRAAIMQREGCVLHTYLDGVGVPTCGCGHTGRASPPTPKMGETFTQAQAEAFLSAALKPFEAAVNAADPKGRLSQNGYDAAVSLAFNIGTSAYAKSTVARCIANNDLAGAADAFLMWDKAGGKVMTGLANRRKAERAQFLTPDAPFRVDADKPVLASIETALNIAAAKGAAQPPKPAPVAASASVPTAAPAHIDTLKAAPRPSFWHVLVAAFTPKKA